MLSATSTGGHWWSERWWLYLLVVISQNSLLVQQLIQVYMNVYMMYRPFQTVVDLYTNKFYVEIYNINGQLAAKFGCIARVRVSQKPSESIARLSMQSKWSQSRMERWEEILCCYHQQSIIFLMGFLKKLQKN